MTPEEEEQQQQEKQTNKNKVLVFMFKSSRNSVFPPGHQSIIPFTF